MIAAVLALAWRRSSIAIFTFIAVGLSDLAAFGLKGAFDVERPPLRYATPKALVPVPRDGSFPSGHTATSFAAATVLSFAAPRSAPAFFLLALAIGFSRVYVGVHYPLDVIGGAAVGILVALALRLLVLSRSRATRRKG